jgi:predicted GNAT family acetyltransferase
MQVMEFEIWRKRHAGLLREAEEERIARRLRKNGRRRGTRGFSKRVRAWLGLVFASQRPAGEGMAGIEVRWSTPEDEEKISELLDLNGAPRAMAVVEGFIVAEKDGEVLAAMRYRTEFKRLLLGMLVVDPWTEERPLAEAMYSGARELAREMDVNRVRARSSSRARYPAVSRRGKLWIV